MPLIIHGKAKKTIITPRRQVAKTAAKSLKGFGSFFSSSFSNAKVPKNSKGSNKIVKTIAVPIIFKKEKIKPAAVSSGVYSKTGGEAWLASGLSAKAVKSGKA